MNFFFSALPPAGGKHRAGTRHPSSAPCRTSQQGFTILEIMIAMVVLAIGVLGVASMQTAAGGSNSVARQIMMAENLASQQIELLMLLPYEDPNNPENPDYPLAVRGGDNPHAMDIRGYRVSWVVADNLMPDRQVKTITVTARSTGIRPGIPRPRVVLTHYKSNL
jgi:prepilin-type N-terminal cleavage/methylation domain-containing protein